MYLHSTSLLYSTAETVFLYQCKQALNMHHATYAIRIFLHLGYPSLTIFVSPERSSERDYVITDSVCM